MQIADKSYVLLLCKTWRQLFIVLHVSEEEDIRLPKREEHSTFHEDSTGAALQQTIYGGSRHKEKVVEDCDFLSSGFKMSGQNLTTTNKVHSEKSDLSVLTNNAVKGCSPKPGKARINIEQVGKQLFKAVKETMKSVTSGEVVKQLLGNTNNAYKISTTRESGSKEEMSVDNFLAKQNLQKGMSSSSPKTLSAFLGPEIILSMLSLR